MGMPASRYYTADMVRDLNARERRFWPRYEVVDGELLVTPAPRKWHYDVADRLELALRIYLGRERVGRAFHAPADISWGERKLVQPDVFVLPLEEARKREWADVQRLLLVAEILSPSTARSDRGIKRRLYQEHGVPVYWVVDSDAHAVEIWTPHDREARREYGLLTWHPAGATSPFELEIADLFRPL